MNGKRLGLFGVLLLLVIVPAAGEKTPLPLRPLRPGAAQGLPVSAVLGYPPPPAAPAPALRPAAAATPASGPAVQGGAPEQTTNYIWRTETVESAGYVGEYTSLELDAAGRPHISYCRVQPYPFRCIALRYAHYDGTAWITETVDTGEDVGSDTSLALDAAGRPHIAYYGGDVRYAHYDGSAWITETVDSGVGNLPWSWTPPAGRTSPTSTFSG